MPSVLQSVLLGFVALAASTLAAITGFGGAAVLLPVLVAVFGMREAVPILTVSQLIGNGSRVWFNRRELDWRVVLWFAVGAVPLALLGGYLFAKAPLSALTRLLGAFLLLVVIWRHVRPRQPKPFPISAFAGIGAGIAFRVAGDAKRAFLLDPSAMKKVRVAANARRHQQSALALRTAKRWHSSA
jgi:uncharacterized membrane protein YfcA